MIGDGWLNNEAIKSQKIEEFKKLTLFFFFKYRLVRHEFLSIQILA